MKKCKKVESNLLDILPPEIIGEIIKFVDEQGVIFSLMRTKRSFYEFFNGDCVYNKCHNTTFYLKRNVVSKINYVVKLCVHYSYKDYDEKTPFLKFTNLEELTTSRNYSAHNKIKQSAFMNLKKLKKVDISCLMQLNIVFQGCENLEELRANMCWFLRDESFNELRNLKKVLISQCNRLMNPFSKCINIEQLFVIHCKKIQDSTFMNLSKLKILDISYCKQLVTPFTWCCKLEQLYAIGCKNLRSESFYHLQNLKILNIDDCTQLNKLIFISNHVQLVHHKLIEHDEIVNFKLREQKKKF